MNSENRRREQRTAQLSIAFAMVFILGMFPLLIKVALKGNIKGMIALMGITTGSFALIAVIITIAFFGSILLVERFRRKRRHTDDIKE